MVRHMEGAHPAQPVLHSCMLCVERFKSLSMLKKHMKDVHGHIAVEISAGEIRREDVVILLF